MSRRAGGVLVALDLRESNARRKHGPPERVNRAAELRARVRVATHLYKIASSPYRLVKDGGDDAATTVRGARTRKVDAFAAALVPLWAALVAGTLTLADYRGQVEDLFDAAVGDVPLAALETIGNLRNQALARANDLGGRFHGHDEADNDLPSGPQQKNWANMVAGAVWGASLAAGIYRAGKQRVTWQTQGDDHVCGPCADLDGTTWDLDKVPFWPGDDDCPCEGGGNDRCDLD